MAFFPPGSFFSNIQTQFRRWSLVVLAPLFFTTVARPAEAGEGSLSSIAEREIQRRQQLVSQAESQLVEATTLDAQGKHEQAAGNLRKIYDSLPDSQSAQGVKDRVRAAYAAASYAWAQELLAKGDYPAANKVINGVLEENVDPGNRALLKLKKHAADPDRFPPALTPEHVANTEKVKALLIQAGSAFDLGDYDKAGASYANVLRIDPFNVAARKGMEKLEQKKSQYFEAARDHARNKLLTTVDSQWEQAVPPKTDVTAMFTGGPASTGSALEKTTNKLRTLRVPKVEFNGASLEETIEYLRVTSRNVDPSGKGISFVVNLDDATKNRTLTLNLQDVPLEELLRYITQLAGASFRVEDNAVVIGSVTEKSTNLITKTYRVPPDFIQTAEVAPAAASTDPFASGQGAAAQSGIKLQRMGARQFLESRGVVFPDGGGASFAAGSSTLIVRTTIDNINLVDMLVENALGAAPKQAKISVRMINVSEETFKEIGSDIGLGQSNVPGSDRVFMSGGAPSPTAMKAADPTGQGAISSLALMTAGNRSSGAILGAPGLDELISRGDDTPSLNSVSPSQFGLRGVFTDPQFDLTFRNIAQTKGVDIVAVPSIVARSGQKSSVRVIREFPYPTEFDPPQIPQQVNSGSSGVAQLQNGVVTFAQSSSGSGAPIIPTTPTAFEKKELGVILEVEPNISADGRSVEISLSPSITDFEGFIDYGSDITNSVGTTTTTFANGLLTTTRPPSYVQPNTILQPVFKKMGATSTVNVYDGSTVILGGVVDERITDIEDKVPVIADIPLVGRLWQSKAKQSKKRCVLFFVTVNVIDPAGQSISQAVQPTATAATVGQ